MSRLPATGHVCLRSLSRQLGHGRGRAPVGPRGFFTSQTASKPSTRRRIVLLASAGALTPAAFIQISTNDSKDGKTHEERMLVESRAELRQHVPKQLEKSKHVRRSVYFFLDIYIWEPAATILRFLHLVFIFVPVIVTIPAVWLGQRVPDKDDERTGTLWWYGFLVSSMERAGATFIKLGQWAASRTDIFPTEMCSIMSSLHSNVPPHSLWQTKQIIEQAFGGRQFEDIFDEFEEKPLGVGAIAQVYKARLKPDLVLPEAKDVQQQTQAEPALQSTPKGVPSSYVAIKVLHPGVDRTVQRDLRIMALFANIINLIPTMQWFSFPDEVAQFAEMMKLQLDLRIEAANLCLFRRNFADRTTAWFPFPYTDYITREMLVEEFALGIPLQDFLSNGAGCFQKEIADEGLDAFLHMLLIDNFTHADLHPGNIMVRFYEPQKAKYPTFGLAYQEDGKASEALQTPKDVTQEVLARLLPHKSKPAGWLAELDQINTQGYRPQIVFIDTGLVTELNDINRRNFLDLFKAVAEFDGYKAGHLMVDRCRQPEEVIDKQVFALRMQHLVLGVKSRTFALGNIKIGDILNEVLTMVRNHHVRLEGDFVNVVLSILLLEGIGRSLDPELDLFAGALPILRKLGTQSGSSMIRGGDFSMLKVWAGLEARSWLHASVDDVSAQFYINVLSALAHAGHL